MTRNEAVKWLQGIEERYFHGGDEAYDKRRREAVRLAIEVLERKQGKNISEDGFLCSVCTFGDFGGFHGYEPNFCPNCGARMSESLKVHEIGKSLVDGIQAGISGADMRGDTDEHTD